LGSVAQIRGSAPLDRQFVGAFLAGSPAFTHVVRFRPTSPSDDEEGISHG
jgi:hypothetical protein